MRRRGFSLIEMMIALVIGSVGVSVAAYVAQLAVRQSGRGAQFNQLASSTQIIARQLRTDLEVAGFGSTGAVGASNAGVFTIPSAGNWAATAAVRGLNNLAANEGGLRPIPGSDMLQVVVPNPRRVVRTDRAVPAGANRGALVAALPPTAPADWNDCPVLYISDHSSSNGAGRTRLLVDNEPLGFDVRLGSDVTCARLSTYWVDADYNLRRADFVPPSAGGNTVNVRNQLRVPVPAADQIIAAGVVDFQVAYRTSTALPNGVTANPDELWAYASPNSGTRASQALSAGGRGWFEVRQVRFNVVFRTLRAVEDRAPVTVGLASEDRTDLDAVLPAPARSGAYRFLRVTSGQSLHNLRMFDLAVPAGVEANPY